VISLSPEKAAAHFGWLAVFAGADLVASSEKTLKNLDWNPAGADRRSATPGLLPSCISVIRLVSGGVYPIWR
jgi:hypothetical protein